MKHTFMVCILFLVHCSHHEGHEEHEKNIRNAERTFLDSFPPVRDFKRILFFVSFVLFVVRYPSVCSSKIQVCFTVMNLKYATKLKRPLLSLGQGSDSRYNPLARGYSMYAGQALPEGRPGGYAPPGQGSI